MLAVCFAATITHAANVVTNGTFTTDLSGWSTNTIVSSGTRAWDNTVFGAASGSIRYRSNNLANADYHVADSQYISTAINPATDTVFLSLYWYKTAVTKNASYDSIFVSVRPVGGSETVIWSEVQKPNSGQVLSGNVTPLNVTASFSQSGNYYLKVRVHVKSGTQTSYAQANLDDMVLDVRKPPPNSAPTVTAGSTTASPVSVNRIGTGTTTLTGNFTDTDNPAVGSFTVSFRVREPNNSTITNVVVNSANGQNGVTIASLGGSNYRATVNWDPASTATRGAYDFRFEVSDGQASAADDYASNLDELMVYSLSAPTITSGNTSASPVSVNRIGANTTRLSATWSDADNQPVDSFWVTFSVRKPDNTSQILVVDSLKNGSGGLVVVDNGNGTYTGYVDWNPADNETLGLYDLRCRVFDGTSATEDGYINNLDELTIVSQAAPTLTASVTTASPTSVNRIGTYTTRLSSTWSDPDGQAISSFRVTFSVREPDNITQFIVVDSSVSGTNGLTVVDNGNGTYTATVDWNPADVQTTGLYDLRCRVIDGAFAVEDGYASNLDELTVTSVSNNVPTVVAGMTSASPTSINRIGIGTTTLSVDFSDADQSAVGTFLVSFRVREPDNSTIVNIVVNSADGQNGVAILSLGGGNYRATVNWDPPSTTTRGAYDLRFEVSDGLASAADDYANNLDELTISSLSAPTITSGNTSASPVSVNRIGANTTRLSATWSDADSQPVDSFWVTFSVRKPDNTTQILVVDSLKNGSGGLVVVDNGNGTYTGYVDWNPADGETVGLYDLRCRVFDGSTAIEDGFANNLDELTVESQAPPAFTAGVTSASPLTVNRIGTDSARLSATWSDPDGQAISSFRVTFSVREPSNISQVIVVDSSVTGTNGLTVVDNGNGTYTAYVDWNPADGQTTGLYDLRCRVFDGLFGAEDGYAANLDELTVASIAANFPPSVIAGATQETTSPVTRLGTATTTIFTSFTDANQPGIGAFRVTFKVRRPDNVLEDVLANNQPNGSGGVIVTDNGGGSYTAQYIWDPDVSQATGLYDLYFMVSDDSSATATDGFANNLDELQVIEAPLNRPPVVARGVTSVLPSAVNRFGNGTTVVYANFSDDDIPGIGAFTVTFKIREPNNTTEVTLVNNQPNGFGGVTITALGGNGYRATYTYNPADNQTLGLYDLYFSVSDGQA
ncbi:MAG: hypothetical protein HY975_03825, partial [Candidatus Kerfeldbacteria bacterium]|nr:hypothetical protein [Candidatus Kerfeldbacteria bacterium]